MWILGLKGLNSELKRGRYLWVLVHASGEILKSPLHVGMSRELACERRRVLTAQPQQTIISR